VGRERPVWRYKCGSSVIKRRRDHRTRIKFNWNGKGMKEGEVVF
jgi:hypothetical protein